MKISALIISLVLGMASAATAAPSYNEHRPVDLIGPPIRSPWTTLSNNEQLRSGRDAVQLFQPVRAGTLRLEANRGSTFVERVQITFANGRTQTIELGQRLHQRQPLTIDVAGRSRMISRIVVFGRGSWGASYRVLAA